MTKAQELLYLVTIESLYLCFMTGGKDTKDAIPTYDTQVYNFDNIVELGIAGNPTNVVKWASGKMFVNASKNTQFTLSLTHVALPQEVKDKIDGVTPNKGIAFETSEVKEYPMFAMGFTARLSDGSRIARWYPRVQKSPAEETFATSTDEQEVRDVSASFLATPLLFNSVTEANFSEVRDSATGVTADDFMKQVVADESQIATLFPGSGVAVTVDPTTASVAAGGTQQLTATVTGATDTSVTWSSSDELIATVDANGLVTVDASATTGETVTITATSVEDGTKTATATITVA
ncbi:Ig-like domain-containing protein [Gracilibacillus sp. D59]|uniref:Ig-like domain-containing protein n=1 Tax=Gracilibacillus sp. D59 TaxID=3457434 RepID=UPI003FCD249F